MESDIEIVVRILRQVPPKKLRIVELLNQIPIKHGELDIKAIAKLGSEIVDARREAEAYKEATHRAIEAIRSLI